MKTGREMGTGCYEDLIHMKRPLSRKHPPMSMEKRAAQFAPFAALTGYEERIREAAMQTEEMFDALGRRVGTTKQLEEVEE